MMETQTGAPRRVAIFHPCLAYGGLQRVFVNLAAGLLDRGVAVDMVQATAETEFRSQVPAAVRLIDLNASRALTSVFPLARYLGSERPDAVISGAIQTNIAAIWARRIAGVPLRLILTEHNMIRTLVNQSPLLRTRISPIFIRKFYPWADKVVAVSQGVAADLASVMRIPAEDIPVIYNPVISGAFWERANEPLADARFTADARPIILAVGRLHFIKNYPSLLKAFAEVRRVLDARLVFLGDGDERGRLLLMVKQLGMEADVTFLGEVKNVLPYMKHASALVMSSHHEALPTVLIEALAVGLPIVSTDCPSGPGEILCGGTYGTLVPMEDSSALARALVAVVSGPRPQPAPSEALQRFEHEAAIDKYLGLLGFSDSTISPLQESMVTARYQ